MMRLPLHPVSTWVVTRPAAAASVNGRPIPGGDTSVGSFSLGVEDITAKVQRSETGRDVRLALRLWDMAAAQQFAYGDLFAGSHNGRAEKLEAHSVEMFPGPRIPHTEIEVRSRL